MCPTIRESIKSVLVLYLINCVHESTCKTALVIIKRLINSLGLNYMHNEIQKS